jgi:hypothetical protein
VCETSDNLPQALRKPAGYEAVRTPRGEARTAPIPVGGGGFQVRKAAVSFDSSVAIADSSVAAR